MRLNDEGTELEFKTEEHVLFDAFRKLFKDSEFNATLETTTTESMSGHVCISHKIVITREGDYEETTSIK